MGYISPDLFTHSVSYFAEAPLSRHDPARVRHIVYSCVLRVRGSRHFMNLRLLLLVGRGVASTAFALGLFPTTFLALSFNFSFNREMAKPTSSGGRWRRRVARGATWRD